MTETEFIEKAGELSSIGTGKCDLCSEQNKDFEEFLRESLIMCYEIAPNRSKNIDVIRLFSHLFITITCSIVKKEYEEEINYLKDVISSYDLKEG